MKCSLCKREAVYEARYSGSSLCEIHLRESVERRVRSEIRKQAGLGSSRTTIAVAVSGGKDSSVALYLMHKILSKRKNTEIFAVTVDEGINGYRDSGIESARKLCDRLGIEHNVLSFRETFGSTLDEIVEKDQETIPCSHCGPMRRDVMNRLAEEVEADYMALGINLDDYAQSVLMNVVKGDYERLIRMAPHENMREGMVRRILPLIRIPEKEAVLYAILSGIEYDHGWCPYFERAQRNSFRETVEKFEDEYPGSRFAILNFSEKLRKNSSLHSDGEIGKCTICGRPSSSEMCPVCRRMEKLKTR